MTAASTLTLRRTTASDLRRLAEMNAALIRDEGADNPMSVLQLEARMAGWIAGAYVAQLFVDDAATVGYALYRFDARDWDKSTSNVYVRQFFVDAAHRRRGIGRAAFQLLRATIWPAGCRVTLEALAGNSRARAFWQSVGMREYAISFELASSRAD